MENDKIRLDALDLKHLEILREWNFDPSVAAYLPSRFPISETEQKKWFDNQIGRNDKKKLLIFDKSSREYVGVIGIMNMDHINKNCEVGITIGNVQKWGKGVAKESLLLVLNSLFNDFNMHVVYAVIFETNERAVKFFSKLGFVKEGLLVDRVFKNGMYHSLQYMSLKKEQFTQ